MFTSAWKLISLLLLRCSFLPFFKDGSLFFKLDEHIKLHSKAKYNTSRPILKYVAVPLHKRLYARLPPVGSRARVSVTLCGFSWWSKRGFGRFSRVFFSYQKFHFTISPHSSHSFHYITPCDGATGVTGRHPWNLLTFNIGASSHPSTRPCVGHDLRFVYFSLL